MAHSHSDSLHESAALQRRMSAVFHSLTRNKVEMPDPDTRDLLSAVGFVPPVDIYEDEDGYVLEIEIPGMLQDQLDVRLETGILTIRGVRHLSRDAGEVSFTRKERRSGAFYRAFPLPHTVDVEEVRARYEAGVLQIRLDRRSNSASRQIEVEVASPPGRPVSIMKPGSKSRA